MFIFFVFDRKYPFGASPKNQNYQLKLEFGTYTNSNMHNSIMLFSFLFLSGNTLFGQILSKKSKLSVESEIWQLDYFEYAEFSDAAHFFCFSVEIPFLAKFGPQNQNSRFKLKFGTYTNSNMQNSMVMFIYFVFDDKQPFWANLVQNIKIIS